MRSHTYKPICHIVTQFSTNVKRHQAFRRHIPSSLFSLSFPEGKKGRAAGDLGSSHSVTVLCTAVLSFCQVLRTPVEELRNPSLADEETMKRLAVISSQCFRLKVADIFLSCPSVFRAASLCAVDGCMGRGYAGGLLWTRHGSFFSSLFNLLLICMICWLRFVALLYNAGFIPTVVFEWVFSSSVLLLILTLTPSLSFKT